MLFFLRSKGLNFLIKKKDLLFRIFMSSLNKKKQGFKNRKSLNYKKGKVNKILVNPNVKSYYNFNINTKYKKLSMKKFKKSKIHKLGFRKRVKISVNLSKKTLKVFDSLIHRRLKLIRKIRKLNNGLQKNLIIRNKALVWVRDYKLTNGLLRYKKFKNFFESQGLQRKVIRRRMTSYAVALHDKQKLKLFYYGLKEKTLRNYVCLAFQSRTNHMDNFLGLLESRLGSFVFRTNFFKSLLNVKHVILLGKVLVNGKKIKSINYKLYPGDVVSFDKKFLTNYLKDKNNVFKKRLSLYFYPSKYMEISFSTLKFCFYSVPKAQDIAFFFNVNFYRVLSFYNRLGLK